MRILLVSTYFPPLHAGASLRVYGFAETWARAGHDVTVLTTHKHAGQRGLDRDRSRFEVVELPYRVPKFVERVRSDARDAASHGVSTTHAAPRDRGPMSWLRGVKERTGIFSVRMPDFTRTWVNPAVAWCRAHGTWDCVVSSYGPYTPLHVALRVRREGMARAWIADFRDLWTENPICPGLFPFTLRERALERACLRHADRVVTVSDGLARALRRTSSAPVDVIYNGYSEDDWTGLDPAPVFPDDSMTRLVFTGRIYPRGQSLTPLFDGLARLRREHPSIADRVRLIVAGDHAEPWSGAAAATGTTDMLERHGRLAHADALRLQRDADGLIMVEFDTPEDGILSGKIFEYLRATAPILVANAAPDDPIASLTSRAGRGIALGADPARIAETLTVLVEDPDRLGVRRKDDVIATFRREYQATKLLELMADG